HVGRRRALATVGSTGCHERGAAGIFEKPLNCGACLPRAVGETINPGADRLEGHGLAAKAATALTVAKVHQRRSDATERSELSACQFLTGIHKMQILLSARIDSGHSARDGQAV